MTKLYRIAFKVFLLLILAATWHGEAKASNNSRARIGLATFASRENGLTEEDARIITNSLSNLIMALRDRSNVSLFERQQIHAALREIGIGTDNILINRSTLPRLGEVAGVEYVFVASVVSLGRETSRSKYGTTYRERVEVNVRMLDVATGEVHLSISRNDSASSSSTSGLRAQAIRDAMDRRGIFGDKSIAERIRDALIKEFPFPQGRATSTSQPRQQRRKGGSYEDRWEQMRSEQEQR
jgi:phage gp36-like protein